VGKGCVEDKRVIVETTIIPQLSSPHSLFTTTSVLLAGTLLQVAEQVIEAVVVVVCIALSRVCSFADIPVTNTVTTSTSQSVTASAKPTVCKLCLGSFVVKGDYIDRLYGSRGCNAVSVSSYDDMASCVSLCLAMMRDKVSITCWRVWCGIVVQGKSKADSSNEITYCEQQIIMTLKRNYYYHTRPLIN
jgi:hypothetical protein